LHSASPLLSIICAPLHDEIFIASFIAQAIENFHTIMTQSYMQKTSTLWTLRTALTVNTQNRQP
jgi:hypothetical protein